MPSYRTSLPRHTAIDAEQSDSTWSCEEGWFGATYCSLDLDDLIAGASDSADLAVTVDSDISDRVSRISIYGTISGDRVRRDRNDGDHESTPIERELRDLRVELSDDGAVVSPGEKVAYTVAYGNDGPADAVSPTISVRLSRGVSLDTDANSDGWTCENGVCTLDVDDVAANESRSATLPVIVDAELWTRRICASASISADGADANRRDNYDHESTPVTRKLPDLSLTIDDGGEGVEPGGTIEYVIGYANEGAADATGTAISLRLPPKTTVDEANIGDWVCEDGTCTLDVGDLGAGVEKSATLAVKVAEDISTRVSRICARASITDDGSAGRDANRRNNYAAESTRVVHALPDLAVSLSDGDAEAKPSGIVEYTFDYTNNGNVDASGTVLSFRAPRHTTVLTEGTDWNCEDRFCTLQIGDLAPGGGDPITLTVTVDPELSPRRRALYAFAGIRDDGEHGRDGNRRDNYSFERTMIVRDEPDGGDPPAGE